jgi:predicted deacylase
MVTTKRIDYIDLPNASIGTRRRLKLIRYGACQTGTKAYIQAGLHADEAPGMLAAYYLEDLLDEADRHGRIKSEIILVPVANPIGLAQWDHDQLVGRFEKASGVNFNRAFPELEAKLAAAIEKFLGPDAQENVVLIRKELGILLEELPANDEGSYLKLQLLRRSYDADVVLDLHCDHEAMLHVYTGTPLWPEIRDLSAQMGAAVTLLAKDSGGGPYDEACSKIWWRLAEHFPEHPIPNACLAATVELRGSCDVTDDFGRADARNLFYFLQRRGFIDGQAPELPALIREASPLAGLEYVRATAPGVLVYEKAIGVEVKHGDVLARVIDPLAETAEQIVVAVKAGSEGYLFARRNDRYARPGSIIAKIAGSKALQGKGAQLLTL